MDKIKNTAIIVFILAGFVRPIALLAADGDGTMPTIPQFMEVVDKATGEQATEGTNWTAPIKLVVVFTALAILPSLLIMTTSFTRIIIVLSFIRKAIGTQNIPPTVAVIGLAMFLTLFTMSPTFVKINDAALKPYLADEMDFNQATDAAGEHLKGFMLRQTREADLTMFLGIAKVVPPKNISEMPWHICVPAFVISEFRTAFEMGCLLYIPFLLIDLVIASVLLSAGMMMLPPVMISLPFKLILFILVDGWSILAKSLSMSFK